VLWVHRSPGSPGKYAGWATTALWHLSHTVWEMANDCAFCATSDGEEALRHLRPCQCGPPRSNLSSRPERSVVEGPAVCVDGKAEPGGGSPTHILLCQKVKPQVPPLRYAPVGMTNLSAVAHLGMGGGGWTESKKS
jgi:hypothetical protein